MSAVVAIFGLILGSFLNVVIHRLPLKGSLIRPASHCPSCSKAIRFYDNIPLVSYIILRGRCRACGARIPLRYPMVEGLTALLLVLLYIRYGMTGEWVAYSVLVLFLIPISFIDLDKKLILNRLTVPCFILGIVLVLGLHVETWTQALLGAVLGGLIVLLIAAMGKLIFKKESMGMGDVKLLVAIGVYVGFPGVALSLFFGVFIAAVVIVGGMSLRKLRLGDIIPFGPFIALGTLVYLLWGESILNWYMGRF